MINLRHQDGQGATEFIIVLPVALLLIFSIMQIALAYQAKTALNYAVFSAARESALHGGTLESVKRGFSVGLAPFYTYDDDPLAVPYAVDQVYRHIDDGLVVFSRINPPVTAFFDFSSILETDAATGLPALPNDNLMYRDATRGSASQLSIQDANLLKIGVLYCYPLSFPLVNTVISKLAEAGGLTNGKYCNSKSKASTPGQPSLPIIASAIVRMQSNLLDDPSWR